MFKITNQFKLSVVQKLFPMFVDFIKKNIDKNGMFVEGPSGQFLFDKRHMLSFIQAVLT